MIKFNNKFNQNTTTLELYSPNGRLASAVQVIPSVDDHTSFLGPPLYPPTKYNLLFRVTKVPLLLANGNVPPVCRC